MDFQHYPCMLLRRRALSHSLQGGTRGLHTGTSLHAPFIKSQTSGWLVLNAGSLTDSDSCQVPPYLWRRIICQPGCTRMTMSTSPQCKMECGHFWNPTNGKISTWAFCKVETRPLTVFLNWEFSHSGAKPTALGALGVGGNPSLIPATEGLRTIRAARAEPSLINLLYCVNKWFVDYVIHFRIYATWINSELPLRSQWATQGWAWCQRCNSRSEVLDFSIERDYPPLKEPGEPMQLGRAWLSHLERQRRLTSRACLYCGQAGQCKLEHWRAFQEPSRGDLVFH